MRIAKEIQFLVAVAGIGFFFSYGIVSFLVDLGLL